MILLLRRIHLWIALTLGAVFVLIGITGSLLVFQSELDRALNPELLRAEAPTGDEISASRALQSVATMTGEEEVVSFLSLPSGGRDVFRAYIGTPERTFDRLVTVDPGSGAIMGVRPVGEGFMRFVHVLHFRLHLGRSGQTFMGVMGLCLLFTVMTGGVLFLRQGHERRRDRIHHSLGVYAGLPLLVVVITGVLLALPQYTRPTVELFSPLSGLGLSHASKPGQDRRDIGLERALSLAQAHMPGGEVRSVGLPRDPEGIYRITLRESDATAWRAGSGHVVLDRYSGEPLARQHWSDASGGDRFMSWLRPLHGGSVLGLPGKVLVAGLGLVPLVMYVTGIRIWLRRRRKFPVNSAQ